MKQTATTRRILCWLTGALSIATLCLVWAQPAQASVLILEVGDADEQPALRLIDLLDSPATRRRVPQASQPNNTISLLRHHDASQAVVFDSAARRVHVVTREGVIKTRIVEGDPPAAYVMAFVAAELLALQAAPDGQVSGHEEASVVARGATRGRLVLAARLGMVTAAPYAGKSLLRAQLGAELWLPFTRHREWLGALGALLETPGHLRQHWNSGELRLRRWDVRPRAGVLFATQKARIQLFGQSRIGFSRLQVQGQATPRTFLSAGLGLGALVEIPATSWLSFYAEAGCDFMARRARYRMDGIARVRERPVLWSGSLGVAVHTPR